ncbi:hypothetical protein ABZ863_20725 [Saccharomonospora sp. NPDC046836]|uniref:hypothetical protein n=1 Tax=Saccharomonospora sp. NPDC046836 TaxID=3156921 RepID=UPI0033F6815D
MRAFAGVIMLAAAVLAGCGGTEPAESEPASPTSGAAEATTTTPSSSPESSAPVETTSPVEEASPGTAGAIERFEQFLAAVGSEDTDTACEIAGPAAKRAEDQGFGSCAETFGLMFQLISPDQKQALRGATVDENGITVESPTKVAIPASAVQATATFTSGDLGDSVLEFIDGQWYVTD